MEKLPGGFLGLARRLAYTRAVEMKIKKGEDMRYQFAELSKQDKEFHEMVLLEEVDMQTWYAVGYSTTLGEVFLPLQ